MKVSESKGYATAVARQGGEHCGERRRWAVVGARAVAR